MYNEENKKWFLNELPTDELRTIYTSIFNRTERFENLLNKDILDFNLEECLGLLVYLNPKSLNGINVYKSQFSKYIDWGIEKHKVVTMKNYWSLVPVDKEYVKCTFKKRHLKNIEGLINVVDTTLSVVYDKYVIYLLYNGIMGYECEELYSIKDVDVDKTNKTIRIEKRNHSVVHAIDPLISLILTGEYESERKSRDLDSPYLIKPFKTKHLAGKPISKQYINRIFEKMNNIYFDTKHERSYYTPMTIWRSGMFSSLYDIEQKKGELTKDDYLTIAERFGKIINPLSGGFKKIIDDYRLFKEVFWL